MPQFQLEGIAGGVGQSPNNINLINQMFSEIYTTGFGGGGTVAGTTVIQSANYTVPDFTTAQQVNGTEVVYKIIGDGVHTLGVPSGWLNTNGIILDNGRVNYLIATYLIDIVVYSVFKTSVTFLEAYALGTTSTNQIVRTSVPPTTLQFGSGTNETPMSISCWVKVPSATGSPNMLGIFSTNAGQSFMFLGVSGVGFFNLYVQDGSGNYIIQTVNSASIPFNTWTHVTVTYSGSRTSSGILFYVNGVLATTTPSTSGTYGGKNIYDSATRLVLATPDNTTPSTAIIDELYFTNLALTQSQVTEIYNGGVVGNPANLSFYSHIVDGWRFENNLLSAIPGGYTLASTSTPGFTTDHP